MKNRILVSNDDGIRAAGIEALAAAIEPLAEVWVVAPEVEQSATSHSLSLHHPLRVREHGPRWFGCDGTPADSVYVAVHHVMKGQRPDLVISGINHGPNLADDVIYSGTVAAAMEGAILGIPAIAFSLVSRKVYQFEHAARFAAQVVQMVLSNAVPARMLLNVNIPPDKPITDYQVTRLGQHSYNADVIENVDPRGRKYFWIGGTGYEHVKEAGTDVTAVLDDGHASITPLMLDLTQHSFLEPLKTWSIDGLSQRSKI